MRSTSHKGISTIETLLVLTILVTLALVALPTLRQNWARAQVRTIAADLQTFIDAIQFYAQSEGHYPDAMSPRDLPPLIASYLPPSLKDDTYAWAYQHSPGRTYTYLPLPPLDHEQILYLDHLTDDGNPATGALRRCPQNLGVYLIFQNQTNPLPTPLP